MTPLRLLLPALLAAAAAVTTTNVTIGTHDLILAGGASFVAGHGAPAGYVALRSGNPGQRSSASLALALAPGSKLTGVSTSFRYLSGYGPTGTGTNVSLSVVSRAAGESKIQTLFASRHYTDYPYTSKVYSPPVQIGVAGISVQVGPPPSDAQPTRLVFEFQNNDRNLQILVPLAMAVTCTGAEVHAACLVRPAPAPAPAPLPPLPPTPAPPATGTPWDIVGPHNIGDSTTPDGGESGTLQPVVAAAAKPDVIYTGGNNNAASSGVLKSVDFGRHWTKVTDGLSDTRIHGLYIVDDEGEHVMVGTPSGVFETINGGKLWAYVNQTRGWGVANSFRNGTISGKTFLFVGTNAGLANVPLVQTPLADEAWNIIPSPPGSASWRTNRVSISDFRAGAELPSSVVGGCLWVGGRGVLHIATVVNETAADWEVQTDQPCQAMAMDPNDADHMLVNNASNGLHIYESTDAGKTFHGCLNYRGAVMVAIDRLGWYYVGSEGGIYRNAGGCTDGKWEAMFDRRIARRTGQIRDKVPHDFQGINIDFGGHPGGVAFGSDQGMFMKNVSDDNMTTNLRFISGNGDMNNNIIMHPSIAQGEEPYSRYVVTALWDWGPCASWDNGTHWPSWQTPDDGAGLGYIGEGGGCFGVGKSKNSLCIHHHNVAYSSRGGKNFSRLVVGNGASVGGPEFARKEGSRSEPSGLVYAPMTMGKPAWDTFADKAIECDASEARGDLGVSTSYSCLSQVDMGTMYRWYDANVAVWRGSTDKHCILCKKAGNSSSWKMDDQKGDLSYARYAGAQLRTIDDYLVPRDNGSDDDDGVVGDDDDDDDDWRHKLWKQKQLEEDPLASEWNAVMPHLEYAGKSQHGITDLSLGGGAVGAGNKYILKSWNFGANWTWIMMPDFLQGSNGFVADPTNDTLYTVAGSCISRSYDQAETWTPCWQAPGLQGSFRGVVVRDSNTLIVLRNGDVPLRTRDGGASWQRMASLENLAHVGFGAAYSWSGKTLAVSGVYGRFFAWVSRDDGDTWTDETGDYTSLSGGIAQWYENTLYISSLGQGISSKTFDE